MDLVPGLADRGGRGDHLGPHGLAVHLPRAQLVHRRLVEADERAQRPGDQVQLVLNDQVRWPQQRVRFGLGRGQFALLEVRLATGQFRGAEAVTVAIGFDLSEKHLDLAVPRHLGELVHGGDQQRRQAAVDLLIDHQHGNAFQRRLLGAERATAQHVAAERDRAATALGVGFHLDVLARVDLGPAPRAVGQLGRGAAPLALELAAVLLLNGFRRLIGRVRRRLLPDPQADAERLLAPLLLVAAPDDLAGADEGRRPLELLDRQQPQRVAHQHGHALLAGATGHASLQPPQGHRVGRQAKVRLRLAAARGKPEQVGHRLVFAGSVHVVELGDAGEIQQDEGQLERIPRTVARLVDGLEVGLLVPPPLLRVDRVEPLLPHGQIRKPEGFRRLLVFLQQLEPGFDPLQGILAAFQGRLARLLVEGHVRFGEVGLPLLDPCGIGRDQRTQLLVQLGGRRLAQLLHVHHQPGQLGPFGLGRRHGAGHLVGRHHLGRDAHRPVTDAFGTLGVDTDAVADAELDLMAVQHRHFLLFGERDRIALAGVALLRPAVENRLAVRRLHAQFGLEEPSRVAQLLRLRLAVDQEERDRPEVVALAEEPLHLDFGKLRVGRPVQPAHLQRDRLRDASAWAPLPDHFLVALGRHERGAAVAVIVAPAGGELQFLGVQIDAERHPEGRREHRLRRGGSDFGGAVLSGPTAPLRQFIEFLGRKLLPLGGEHPDEVAVAHAGLVDLLFLPADRAEEVVQDHLLQFVPNSHGGRGALQDAAHSRRPKCQFRHV